MLCVCVCVRACVRACVCDIKKPHRGGDMGPPPLWGPHVL